LFNSITTSVYFSSSESSEGVTYLNLDQKIITILKKLKIDCYNNFQIAVNSDINFSSPKFETKSPKFTFRLLIVFKNAKLQVYYDIFSNPLKEWNITERISESEIDDLVKVVVKTMFEKFKNSVE